MGGDPRIKLSSNAADAFRDHDYSHTAISSDRFFVSLSPCAGKEQMKIMTDQLFKHNMDEAEKEFSYTEFLQLVDPGNGILGQAAKKGR